MERPGSPWTCRRWRHIPWLARAMPIGTKMMPLLVDAKGGACQGKDGHDDRDHELSFPLVARASFPMPRSMAPVSMMMLNMPATTKIKKMIDESVVEALRNRFEQLEETNRTGFNGMIAGPRRPQSVHRLLHGHIRLPA